MAQEAVVEGSPPASASGEESGEGMEFSPEKSPALAKSHSPIAKLMERTGYSIVQQNGQRRYGPPPDWDGSPPPRGSEVFIGKIPRDCFEVNTYGSCRRFSVAACVCWRIPLFLVRCVVWHCVLRLAVQY